MLIVITYKDKTPHRFGEELFSIETHNKLYVPFYRVISIHSYFIIKTIKGKI